MTCVLLRAASPRNSKSSAIDVRLAQRALPCCLFFAFVFIAPASLKIVLAAGQVAHSGQTKLNTTKKEHQRFRAVNKIHQKAGGPPDPAAPAAVVHQVHE